jgi:hypothetical protein
VSCGLDDGYLIYMIPFDSFTNGFHRYRVKSVACILHDSLPQSFGGKIVDEK